MKNRSFSQKALFVLCLWLCSGASLYSGDIREHQLKVTGTWNGTFLEVFKVQKRDAEKDASRGRLYGLIDSLDKKNRILSIAGMSIEWNNSTEFEGTSPESIFIKQMVKVKGTLSGKNQILAASIEFIEGKLDELKVLGSVTESVRLQNGQIKILIFGVPALVPENLLSQPTSMTNQSLVPKESLPQSISITDRLDDKRPEEQLSLSLFGKPLTIGGEIKFKSTLENDFALDDGGSDKDDKLSFKLGTELELLYHPSTNITIFVEGTMNAEKEVLPDVEDRKSVSDIQRGETWLYWKHFFSSGFSLQIGRQSFQEKRTWWWDDKLDAIRLYYDRDSLSFELGVAQELAKVSSEKSHIDPREEEVLRILSRSELKWAKDQRLETFFLYQQDHSKTEQIGDVVHKAKRDESDADLFWLGFRSSGEVNYEHLGNLYYWWDNAFMKGKETLVDYDRISGNSTERIVGRKIDHDVQGWATDMGLTFQTKLPHKPTVTFGYAVGSGDDDLESSTDNAFRQTGLHLNNGKFQGVDRFRYYGELLRPELSNIHIFTASLGCQLWKDSSVEILYHHYQQVKAADFLRDGDIDIDPSGNNREIGNALDLVLGIEEWEHWEIEVVGAFFWAGDAYATSSGKISKAFIVKVNYNF